MTSPCVLLADDAADLRGLVATVLGRDGCVVHEADSGLRVLEILRRGLAPDLILLDVQMPELDGYSVLRWIRNNAATSDIAVVFCTVKASEADEELARELGCNGFVGKPFRLNDLRHEVRRVLNDARSAPA